MTKLYLTNSPVKDLSSDSDFLLSFTPGGLLDGLQTSTTNTVASGTNVQATASAGGSLLRWISNPLNPVNLVMVNVSLFLTANLWMAESNMSANVGARIVDVGAIVSATGATASYSVSATAGVELPVTTRAAQNFTIDGNSNRGLLEADRLYIVVGGGNIGTMASSFTFSLGYNGVTGAADGDSYIDFNATLTQRVVGTTRSIRQAINRSATF